MSAADPTDRYVHEYVQCTSRFCPGRHRDHCDVCSGWTRNRWCLAAPARTEESPR